MEVKKYVIDGKEILVCANTKEEKAVDYKVWPKKAENLEKTQEIILDDLKQQMLDRTIIFDRNDINE